MNFLEVRSWWYHFVRIFDLYSNTRWTTSSEEHSPRISAIFDRFRRLTCLQDYNRLRRASMLWIRYNQAYRIWCENWKADQAHQKLEFYSQMQGTLELTAAFCCRAFLRRRYVEVNMVFFSISVLNVLALRDSLMIHWEKHTLLSLRFIPFQLSRDMHPITSNAVLTTMKFSAEPIKPSTEPLPPFHYNSWTPLPSKKKGSHGYTPCQVLPHAPETTYIHFFFPFSFHTECCWIPAKHRTLHGTTTTPQRVIHQSAKHLTN